MSPAMKLAHSALRPLQTLERAILRGLTRVGYAFAATDRTCKEDGCTRPLFFWQRGKYCMKHSRARRVPTVMVVLGKNSRSK